MNVLFLPENIASMPSLTATALSKIAGVSASCLTTSVHKYQQGGNHVVVLPQAVSKRKPFKWILYYITFNKQVRKWIKWADIIHYTWSTLYPDGRDLKYANKLGKKIFVEWIGSEIRNPEYLSDINPYYKKAFSNGYEYAKNESAAQAENNQKLFAKYKAIPLLCPEMSLFLNKNIFPKFHLLFQRINIKDFVPVFPEVMKKKILIVHSPTAKVAKGSQVIMDIIQELQNEYEIDFVLLHNVSRDEVLKTISTADIFVDQIVLGSYGMATMEALAFGKPVVCYIMPQVFEAGLPAECPIVNANAKNLKEELVKLITNAEMRNNIGKLGREYVKKYHDVEKISKQLVDIYTM